jgi:hypothetical protein
MGPSPPMPPDPWSLNPSMWPTFDRTRRRLLGSRPSPDRDLVIDPTGADAPLAASPATATVDCVLAIGRPEVQRLAGALQELLGADAELPDTPARLETALTQAIARLGGGGLPRVTRRPPGLYTPEAWQVHLVAVRPAVSEAIRGAIRTGGFA